MMEQQQTSKTRIADGIILIGSKPIGIYLNAVMMQFNRGMKEITLKSRGKFISRAVDIAEIMIKGDMIKEVKKGKISTSSESFTNKEGRDVRVSCIEIHLELDRKS